MRYRVYLQNRLNPAFMITCNGVVIHTTHSVQWALGHDFQQVNDILKTLNARWEVVSPRIDKPRHSHWLSYDGESSGQILQD